MNNYRKLTYGGLIGALVFLGTYVLAFPIPNGYLNLGDGFILISSVILGPFAAVPAAIGSILADISAGYAMYVPFTFVIKGLVAYVPAMLLKGKKITWKTLVFPFAAAELIMVAGYFIADTILWDLGGLAALPFNLLQGLFGLLIGLLGTVVVVKSGIKRS
ncbi:ECF transporter S component [Proteiniclasticum sp. SCR006]|uniref:ECF transporter S component n=1 Tax=Proteiniclasticum aestuarii TaxID=2817862 RepID=A0A939HB08_9CLOT|nr:ECF transporter S component [Proteiniclasticum aestuarii]MBO1264008.1 ECF transporter S component [Proteiniclasticum aestuarii]